MNVTLTSLEALILKATHESLPCPDPAAIEAFCTIMRDSAEGPQFAAQALAARIHASNKCEALLALTMLDRCMRRCDSNFHAEVGKFRFLNEMIKLVSPKYFADRTAPEVRTRVLQLLHAWSIEYPKESKFKVAYDMLKNQGVVKETPPPLPPDDSTPIPKLRAKNAIFEDEEKSKLLQKLLQSKKPEDLQHANRLIKTMVKEEERRTEASSRKALEVSSALDSAGLLREMLEHAADASRDERQLIHELHGRCTRLKPVLHRLAQGDQKDQALDDILYANDILDEVFEKYNAFVDEEIHKIKKSKLESQLTNGDSLLDFAGANITREDKNLPTCGKKNSLDELGDIFSTEASASNIAEPLKPVTLVVNDESEISSDKITGKVEGWNELDSLGEQLLKKSLPENVKRLDGFIGKSTKKIPMNALEKTSPHHVLQPSNDGAMLDLDFFTKRELEKRQSPSPTLPTISNDDVIVDITSSSTNQITPKPSPIKNCPLDSILDLQVPFENNIVENKETDTSQTEKTISTSDNKKVMEVKPLTDINVTLSSVKPSKVPPLTVFEEDSGVTVVLHFCVDKPRSDVNIMVISTTSKNSSPIEDYKFQAVLPKGCKVRLLPASGTSLPAYNPFLPPPALTQVMLIARPPDLAVSLKFVITYVCDQDTYSEIGEVPSLPLDDI
ncbi:ADP-ribosylation factor-binding protein GGA2 [Eumeta japonica]|uniref:ADP-ribosylation factor-binding protein GGA2 n=1 Tax=Eumeta variegata TaxID=151549 RepID=A0A4C1V4M0_EUMVA|nr:ADP-ribosylation factor-binding protein GGA2 [Eumeta japonica]